MAFGISYSSSSSKAFVSSKDRLNSGYNDYGDLDNDGNSLTASSGEEDAQTAENFKMADELNESELANTCRMRNSKSRNFYAANLLRWEADERSQAMAKPVQSPFVRCKEARVMLGGRSILERCERAGGSYPLDGAND